MNRVRYYARISYRVPAVVLLAAASSFATLLTSSAPRRAWIANAYFQTVLKMMGIKVVANRDLSAERGTIFAPNHISYQDIMIMLARTNGRFVATGRARKIPIYGGAAARIGCIFVERGTGGMYQHLLNAATPALDGGDNIIIFPEGQTTTEPMRPFKRGAFGLSKNSGAPIMPIVIKYDNIDEVAWGFLISDVGLFTHLVRFLGSYREQEIRLIALPKIDPASFDDTDELRSAVRDAMQRVYDDESLHDADLEGLDLYGLAARAN